MSYQENYQKWVDFAELPDYLRQDLENMDEKTKEDAFYTNLEFGTAGMRGLIGAGTNRINIYVVRQATEGLARLIESKGGNEKERGVAIAYDSRHFSPEFAFESAAVLAKHGIKSYVFESLRPTPELSFAVRHLNCFADDFNQARSFFSFHISNFNCKWVFDCTDIISQSVRVVWRHLSTVFTVNLVTVKWSRVVAGCDHDTCKTVEVTNCK